MIPKRPWSQPPYAAFPYYFLIQGRSQESNWPPRITRVVSFGETEAHAASFLLDAIPIEERTHVWRISASEHKDIEITHRLNEQPENGERKSDERYRTKSTR